MATGHEVGDEHPQDTLILFPMTTEAVTYAIHMFNESIYFSKNLTFIIDNWTSFGYSSLTRPRQESFDDSLFEDYVDFPRVS